METANLNAKKFCVLCDLAPLRLVNFFGHGHVFFARTRARARFLGKKKHHGCGAEIKKPGGALLSRALVHSTIGEEGLDFRVRNGIGYFPFSMTTRKTLVYIINLNQCLRRLESI
jgi:hypothetical protein